MPNYGVQKSSINAVLSWFDKQDKTKFAIYRGAKENDSYLTGSYHGTDKEDAMQVLQSLLNEIEPQDYNVYFLKILPDNAKTKVATPGVTFQLYNQQSNFSNQLAGTNNVQANVLNEVLNEIRALREERLQQLASDDDDDDDDVQPNDNILAGLLNQPQMQNLLMGILANVFTNKPVQAVAGIETDETSLQQHLDLLFSKGVTVEDIGKLAAMDKAQISFLLSMLRK